MGKPIVYCSQCGAGLREASNERVVQVEGKIFCTKCRPGLPTETPKAFRRDDLPRPPSRGGSGTRKIPHVHDTPRSFAMRSAPSRSPLLAIAVGISVFLLVLVIAVASSKGRRPAPPPAPPPPPPPTRAVAPRPVVPLPTPPPPPEPKADYARELAELDGQVAALQAKEEFKRGVDLLEAARKRRSGPEWTEPVDRRIRDLNAHAMARFSSLLEESLKAPPEMQREARRRIEAWGRPDFVEELDRRIAAAAADRPWEKIFDGTSNDFLGRLSKESWIVANGGLEQRGADNAAQTAREFADGEFRIRFVVFGPTNTFFNARQGGDGNYRLGWGALKPFVREGQPHEVVMTMRGPGVTATIDGQPVEVTPEGKGSARGRLQFNGSNMRVLSIEYRP